MNLSEIEKDDINCKFSDYFDFHQILGYGSFGVVVSAISKASHDECAVKIISKKSLNPGEFDRLREEAYILSSLRHPNIVKFKEFKETDTKILIAMEQVPGGHLKSLMNDKKQSGSWFTESEIALIMRTIFKAIEYIHNKNIVHRDIKPENILIQDKNDLTSLKIADFGLSAQFGRSNMTKIMTQQCGTVIFMAPEQLANKIYSKPVDMWSCGILMYMFFAHGEHPLFKPEDTIKQFSQKLNKKIIEFPSEIEISSLAKNLFSKLTQHDPAERYTADKALGHPWITGNLNDQVPLTTNEMFLSFEKEQNFMKIIKTLSFISYCLQATGHSKITPQYRELIKKTTKNQKTKENFTLESAYIETIFNNISTENPKKLSNFTITPSNFTNNLSEMPTKTTKNLENIRISQFFTQKPSSEPRKSLQSKRFSEKTNEILKENIDNFCDETKNELENSRLFGHQTADESKDTNFTGNSSQNRGKKEHDFVLKVKNSENSKKNTNFSRKSKSKRAISASNKKKDKKTKENQEKIEQKIPQIVKKSFDLTENVNSLPANPKRQLSITPVSSQYKHIKSRIFAISNNNNSNYKEKHVIKSETLIPGPSIGTQLPSIRNSFARNEHKNLIKPNNKLMIPNEYIVKQPITLTLNPPTTSKYNNKRIKYRKKLF